MKLLVCASEYFPHGSGIANVIYNVVEQLKIQGVECTVCSPTGPDIILGNKRLIDKFGFLGLLYYWYQVSHFFKKTDYDVVWLQNPYFIGRNPFPRCMVTMHSTYYGMVHHNVGNTFFLKIYNTIVAFCERYCLEKISKTTLFTGVGQPVCDELKTIGIAGEQIVYIPNGVDITKFHPSEDKKKLREKFKIPADEIILLSIGRLTPQKQPFVLIDNFSIIEKRIKNISLYISGKGELYEAATNRAERMRIQKIHFLGYIKDDDIPDLYACSDYFISTSKYEGGQPPLTLAEAMASGLPCIMSDISPHLNIIRESDCGIVVHFENVETTSAQLYNYLTERHQDHSKNARKYVEKNLDWSILSKRYFTVLKKQCDYPL
jgi:glycosyltransferase involved in cell wall biosynthesis